MKRRVVFSVLAVVAVAAGNHGVRATDRPDRDSVMKMVEGWPAASREAATAMISKHGPPQGATPTMIVWEGPSPWKWSMLRRDPIPHRFPMEHMDVLEQAIDYRVPWDKFDALAAYDGSVMAERTQGILSARCDKTEMNFLAINLAHDVVSGKRSVEAARRMYAETAMAFKKGDKRPYTQGLQFEVPRGGTMDPDQPHR